MKSLFISKSGLLIKVYISLECHNSVQFKGFFIVHPHIIRHISFSIFTMVWNPCKLKKWCRLWNTTQELEEWGSLLKHFEVLVRASDQFISCICAKLHFQYHNKQLVVFLKWIWYSSEKKRINIYIFILIVNVANIQEGRNCRKNWVHRKET